MRDSECVEFLQWALPRLRMRWPGFRKVRKQVCKRIGRRMRELGLSELPAYQAYLQIDPAEWAELDTLCRIPISRFYRNKGVFETLGRDVLPDLAVQAVGRGEKELICWSAGCASGEEPYTLAILWKECVAARFPALGIRIVATDADANMLQRAYSGCYPSSSVKHLPESWVAKAFIQSGKEYCIDAAYKERVVFLQQDVRSIVPEGPFHMILCRNLVFTYFDDALQRKVLEEIVDKLPAESAFVIGHHEALPEGVAGLIPWFKDHGIYRKRKSGDALSV